MAGSPEENQESGLALECWTADLTKRCEDATWPSIVPPAFASVGVVEAKFVVRFRKFDSKARNAALRLSFGNVTSDFDPYRQTGYISGPELTILLVTRNGSPKAVWSPGFVDFQVPPSKQGTAAASFTNVGDGLLAVEAFQVDLPPNVTLHAVDAAQLPGAVSGKVTWTPQAPIKVLPGAGLHFQFDYAPSGKAGAKGTVQAICNDPTAVPLAVVATLSTGP